MPSSSLSNSLRTRISLLVVLLLVSISVACQTQTASDTRATDETALRNQDNEWSKAAGTKDVGKTVSFYADDAIVLPPNIQAIMSKDSIHAMWKVMLVAPGSSISWKSGKVEVARSGELGYVTGTYETTENDAAGKPMNDKGKYLVVWKKQADGSWKCIVDMFSSDLPAAAAENKGASDKKSSPEKSK